MELNILLAETNREDAESLERAIGIKLDQPMAGVNVRVKIVRTLAEVYRYCEQSNVILIDLILDDATPEQVIAAIPDLPEPVIVITDIIDKTLHAQCELAGAMCLVKSDVRNNEVYRAILYCLKKSIRQSLTGFPT